VTTITAALAVTSLARTLVKLYRDTRYTGTLVDATSKPIQVREMPGWSQKQVLVITRAGAQFYNLEDEAIAADSLGKLVELLKVRDSE
jgi:hypothetical protein